MKTEAWNMYIEWGVEIILKKNILLALALA